MKHVFGISVIVLPFLLLLIWVTRLDRRKSQDRHDLLSKIAQYFGSKKELEAFELNIMVGEGNFQVGIGHGGESDPDKLYISQQFQPMPDGIIFIFQRGINRWFSRKLTTGDRRFDRVVSYQVNAFQKQPDRYQIAEQLCDDSQFRKAVLRVADAGYSHLWIPGAWSRGSRLDAITQKMMGVTGMLMAYVDNPKAKHYEPSRVEEIGLALAVIAESVEARRMLA